MNISEIGAVHAIFATSGKTGRAGRSGCCRCPDFVRGFCWQCDGCSRCGLYAGAIAADGCADPLGAGSFNAARIWSALPRGDGHASSDYSGRSVARGRCTLGDGRRAALSWAWRGHWRSLGRPTRVGFHRDQTAGHAIRGGQSALLVDPARGCRKFKRGARSLACVVAPVRGEPARRAGVGCAALVAGFVPLASVETGDMGGRI